MSMRSGDWVEVRTKDEILSSLDKSDRLDGLPFMPQMFQYFGKRSAALKRGVADALRQTSATGAPSSACFTTNAICAAPSWNSPRPDGDHNWKIPVPIGPIWREQVKTSRHTGAL